MPELDSYDYALLRVVPNVDRGECINCGIVLFCKTKKYLGAVTQLDVDLLRILDPNLDVDEIKRHLDLIPRISAGDPSAGPIAQLPQSERFHWLVAPRSTVIQTSPVHSGLCSDPEETLNRLLRSMVSRSQSTANGL